ncbi:halocyanin domain-containing protein [Halorarum salinum]|uniref:Halocyanin domain-containing protein n=1 Tax=Halorarum salinum TaxID=2743089 RepID=A0A7D5LBG3_9EURY|nr:halocyanin domain-containing protein [Halobaculum salinum]QLG62115.1 halocyanin domain-containing protein [Halobaculum salinum]
MTDSTGTTTRTERRPFLRAIGATAVAGTAALAGCAGADGGSGDGEYDGWMESAVGYDGETADRTGEDEVTVEVGAGDGYSFSPAAVRVTDGTTVVWEWTGRGSRHNVVDEGGSYESPYYRAEGETFEHAFEEVGTSKYACDPHRNMGMKGVVDVVEG